MSEVEAGRSAVKVLRAAAEYTGKQGLRYAPGISAETAGSKGLHLQMLRMPPGAKARAHLHEQHETAVYVLSGHSGMWYGPELAEHVLVGEGDFLYIPPGVPHLPYNTSDTEPCVAVIARTDPNEQESVVLLPELDAIHP
jgi:uncharacterized RmlC-like cupin family protein